jgi:hypothetical protein
MINDTILAWLQEFQVRDTARQELPPLLDYEREFEASAEEDDAPTIEELVDHLLDYAPEPWDVEVWWDDEIPSDRYAQILDGDPPSGREKRAWEDSWLEFSVTSCFSEELVELCGQRYGDQDREKLVDRAFRLLIDRLEETRFLGRSMRGSERGWPRTGRSSHSDEGQLPPISNLEVSEINPEDEIVDSTPGESDAISADTERDREVASSPRRAP